MPGPAYSSSIISLLSKVLLFTNLALSNSSLQPAILWQLQVKRQARRGSNTKMSTLSFSASKLFPHHQILSSQSVLQSSTMHSFSLTSLPARYYEMIIIPTHIDQLTHLSKNYLSLKNEINWLVISPVTLLTNSYSPWASSHLDSQGKLF